MAVAIQTKPRLRYSSKGWLRFLFAYETGATDYRTGRRLPDRDGCYIRELWVGPFDTFEDAVIHVW